MKWFLLFLALLLTGCMPKHKVLTHIRVIMDWYPGAEQGGFYCAKVMGYFEQEGLDVDIVPGFPGLDSLKVVSEGEAEFGLGHSDFVIRQQSRYEPLLAVYAYIPWNNGALMIHESDFDNIKSIADMGERVWLIGPQRFFWKWLVKKYNLNDVMTVDNFSYIDEFIRHPGYIQEICVNDEPFLMQERHQNYRYFALRDIYPVQRVVVTTTRYAEDHPEIVRKFLMAVKHGWQDYMENTEAIAATDKYMIKINTRLSQPYVDFNRFTLHTGHYVFDKTKGIDWGEVDPKTWKQMYDILDQIGELAHPFQPETGFTNKYIH